jgi:hypothetical protein
MSEKINLDDCEIVSVRYPTDDETLHRKIFEKVALETIPFLNSHLRQLVTIDSAFAGLIFLLQDKGYIDKGLTIVSAVFILISLASAIIGMWPHYAEVSISDVIGRKNAIVNGTASKRLWSSLSGVFLILGVASIIIRIIAQ